MELHTHRLLHLGDEEGRRATPPDTRRPGGAPPTAAVRLARLGELVNNSGTLAGVWSGRSRVAGWGVR